jgi:hypothetical protein
MTPRKISISSIPAEACGDWHDKPVRWAVYGPAGEVQKFSSRKNAQKYKSLRVQSDNQKNAINEYVRRP